MHAGQGCALTTRVLVARRSYDEAVEIATATFGTAGVGSPTEPATVVGPLISARQRERVLGLIKSGKAQGARGADAPFGGYKLSGIGRQNGIEGFEQHLETKQWHSPE